MDAFTPVLELTETDQVPLAFQWPLMEEGTVKLLVKVVRQEFRVVRSLGFPESFEFHFKHFPRSPAATGALFIGIEFEEILAQGSCPWFPCFGIDGFHRLAEFSDLGLDHPEFLVVLCIRLPVAQKTTALGQVVQGPAQFKRGERLVQATGS